MTIESSLGVVFWVGDCTFKSEPSPTSAHACWEVTSCALATKRSAHVASEVDLGECTWHSPLQKANKAEPTLALKPRRDVTRNPKQGCQWPQKRICVRQKLFKKKFSGRQFSQMLNHVGVFLIFYPHRSLNYFINRKLYTKNYVTNHFYVLQREMKRNIVRTSNIYSKAKALVLKNH